MVAREAISLSGPLTIGTHGWSAISIAVTSTSSSIPFAVASRHRSSQSVAIETTRAATVVVSTHRTHTDRATVAQRARVESSAQSSPNPRAALRRGWCTKLSDCINEKRETEHMLSLVGRHKHTV